MFPSTPAGIPKTYIRFSTGSTDTFVFAPTGNGYSVVGQYYAKLTLLRDDGDGINWLTTNAPDLLLYGSLLEAEPFIKNDPRIPIWQQFYAQAFKDVVSQDKNERYSGSTIQIRTA